MRLVANGVPGQVVGLSVSGCTGMLAETGVPRQLASVSPGQLEGLPGAPLGKRWASLLESAGRPQKVRSAAASGVDWLMSCTVKRNP